MFIRIIKKSVQTFSFSTKQQSECYESPPLSSPEWKEGYLFIYKSTPCRYIIIIVNRIDRRRAVYYWEGREKEKCIFSLHVVYNACLCAFSHQQPGEQSLTGEEANFV